MPKQKRDAETITLGSGKIFIMEYDGSKIPDNETLETEKNRLGHVSGGASLEYAPEYYNAEDDLGVVKKSKITKEEAKMKSGILTWNGNSLAKLAGTARVSEDKAKGTRTLKIGGLSTDNGKSYVIRFLHEDKVDGNVRVTIVGKCTSGFEIAFAKDKETVIDAEFTALPNDAEGTLIIIDEEIPTGI